MKVIIIEDEKPAARQLQRMLSQFPDLEIAAVIHSVEEGVEWFKTHEHPQLIFSDIVLGDGLSFDIFDVIDVNNRLPIHTKKQRRIQNAFQLF